MNLEYMDSMNGGWERGEAVMQGSGVMQLGRQHGGRKQGKGVEEGKGAT